VYNETSWLNVWRDGILTLGDDGNLFRMSTSSTMREFAEKANGK